MSHCKKSNCEGPHSEFVGALIALVVVTIIFNGIWPWNPWWAVVVKLILVFHMIKEFIQWISNDARSTYRYHTKGDDVWGLLIATVIVSVALALIFPFDPWFAQIAPAVLKIKLVEVIILFCITKSQDQKEKMSNHVAAHSKLYGNPHVYHRPRRTITVVESRGSSVEMPNEFYTPADEPQSAPAIFCPMCGDKHAPDHQFCQNCGARLR